MGLCIYFPQNVFTWNFEDLGYSAIMHIKPIFNVPGSGHGLKLLKLQLDFECLGYCLIILNPQCILYMLEEKLVVSAFFYTFLLPLYERFFLIIITTS